MESELLRDLMVIFVVAVVVVVVLRRVGAPSIAAFIIAGVLVGPNTLGIIDDVHEKVRTASITQQLEGIRDHGGEESVDVG